MALLALAASCIVLSASAAVASPAAVGPGKPTLTLNYLDITTAQFAAFPPNRRPQPGDRFFFHDDFYQWNGTKRGAHIGYANGSAMFMLGNAVQISAVGHLPGGTLTVVGETGNQRVSVFAVVGGTGRYATARGELIVRSLGGPNSNKSTNTILLWM
jgi:hypothetical protein